MGNFNGTCTRDETLILENENPSKRLRNVITLRQRTNYSDAPATAHTAGSGE